MLLKMFTVFDRKAKAYMQPFYAQTTGHAIRSFEDTCNDNSHMFYKHPNDFELYEIATYDDQTARINNLENILTLMNAAQARTQQEIFNNENEIDDNAPLLRSTQG